MNELTERIERRVRREWPGVHHFDRHGESIIAPVRPGGATDGLINLMATIVEQETASLLEENADLANKVWELTRKTRAFDPWEQEEEDA